MKKNAGMTMVEVTVAFTLLLIGIAFLYRATTFSLEELRQAKEVQQNLDNASKEYYERPSQASVVGDTSKMTITMGSGIDAEAETWNMNLQKGTSTKDNYKVYFFKLEGGGS